jgi:polar amino acid transport system substrate-binding protein
MTRFSRRSDRIRFNVQEGENMTKTLLALAATLALGTTAIADTVKIGVAAEPYPPFSSPDSSGQWVGWEIDFMNAICKQAQLECELTPVAWDGLIPALTAGQIDVIMSSMSITEERMQTIDFSDKYYNTPTVIIAAKGSGITPDAVGLTGKILGAQVSTTHERYATKNFQSAVAELKLYQTVDEANQDLTAGRIDALMGDSIGVEQFLKTDAGAACCEIVGAVADDPAVLGLGIGFGLRKDDPLKTTLNASIAAIRADGTYDAITKKYFTSDIYGATN